MASAHTLVAVRIGGIVGKEAETRQAATKVRRMAYAYVYLKVNAIPIYVYIHLKVNAIPIYIYIYT